MPIRPEPLPPELNYAVFTATEARRAGVPPPRLRAGDLRSLGSELWARVEKTVTEREIVAALCRRDGAVFAAGLTAARIWGIPLPGDFGKQIVSAPGHARRHNGRTVHRPRGKGVDTRIHLGTTGVRRRDTALVRWSRLDLAPDLLAGPPDGSTGPPEVRLTSRVRTFLDLSGLLREDDLVMIGDHLVRRPRTHLEGRSEPYATIEQLAREASELRGRGARKAREVVARVRVGSDSPAETRLRLALLRAGLPEPLLNVRAIAELDGSGGPLDLGEPDLHWPQWRVAVEHEGPTHLKAEQMAKDIARGERRVRAGWMEVRTTAEDLHDRCRRGVDRVRDALQRQGWTPS